MTTEKMEASAVPEKGTSEYDAYLAKVSDDRLGASEEQAVPPEESSEGPTKPEHVPDKYWNSDTGTVNFEAWSKETSYYASKAHGQSDNSEDKEGLEGKSEESDDSKENIEGPSVEAMDRYAEEFTSTGELSDDSYQELESKHGLSKAYVDTYIAGLHAIQANQESQLYSITGDKDGFEAMSKWAAENMDKKDIDRFNSKMGDPDFSVALDAVKLLNQEYVSATGQDGNIHQAGNNTSNTDVYQSRGEVMEDMKNPRYKTDSAFRKRVEEKLGRSPDNILFV